MKRERETAFSKLDIKADAGDIDMIDRLPYNRNNVLPCDP